MSKKCKGEFECDCCCGYVYPMSMCGGYQNTLGCGGGFDPCRLALFLLILKRACIIDHETATILIFLFMLCCKGFGSRSICACGC